MSNSTIDDSQPVGLAPVHGSAFLFRHVGETIEMIDGGMVELIELVDAGGVVKKTVHFMGEQVATLYARITRTPSSPRWTENRPNVQAVPAAAGGSESTQKPSPPLGTSE